MRYDPNRHHRQSIRLKGYDYTRAGAYFITVCTHRRACLFGEVVDGEMRLSLYGEIAHEEWDCTGTIRPDVVLDAFVVMPNHIHGIITLGGATRRVAPSRETAPTSGRGNTPESDRPRGPTSGSIGAIIGQFKSIATKRINRLRGTPGASVWQRDYYDRIIRDANGMAAIRRYIQDNPAAWGYDRNNPRAPSLSRDEVCHILVAEYGFARDGFDFIIDCDIQYHTDGSV